MIKDFTHRCTEKQRIDNILSSKYPKERQLWYVALGLNVGDEENGKNGFVRPILVVKKIGSLFFVLPLTTKIKYNIFHYYLHTSTIRHKTSSIILSQGRVIDRKRFQTHIGWIGSKEFGYIKKLLHRMYL